MRYISALKFSSEWWDLIILRFERIRTLLFLWNHRYCLFSSHRQNFSFWEWHFWIIVPFFLFNLGKTFKICYLSPLENVSIIRKIIKRYEVNLCNSASSASLSQWFGNFKIQQLVKEIHIWKLWLLSSLGMFTEACKNGWVSNDTSG